MQSLLDWFRLPGIASNAIAVAAEVRPGNAKSRRFAGAGTEGENVVENPAEPDIELVNRVRREDVRFAYDRVAAMVIDVLIAAKRIDLGPSRRTARNKIGCLIVAETGKYGILSGEVVVDPDVASPFVESPHRLIDIVKT